jgi:hypothetical protein
MTRLPRTFYLRTPTQSRRPELFVGMEEIAMDLELELGSTHADSGVRRSANLIGYINISLH